MIPVDVHSVATDSSQKHYFAVLTARMDGEDRWLPVQLGAAEAVSIATEINETEPDRPGSHDLITRSIEEVGGSVQEITLRREDDDVQANICLKSVGGTESSIEARPSDALAIAVRSGVDVTVEEDLLRESSANFEEYFQHAHPSQEVTELRKDLQEAVESENYERASELKNELQSAKRRHEESMNLEGRIDEELETAFGEGGD